MPNKKHKPSWNKFQSERLELLLNAQKEDPSITWVGYYCSDQHGRPANGGSKKPDQTFYTGRMQSQEGALKICKNGFHATREPHMWNGCRVWIVALLGKRIDEDDKSCALNREIIGEILPEDVIDAKIAIRLRCHLDKLSGADLSGADLSGAYLSEAYLSGAYLSEAYLSRANLSEAYLSRANLSGANLLRADLSGADLSGANLLRADLSGADLSEANLSKAYLLRANLSGADLSRADLSRADLSGADLSRANLSGADLSRANLSGADLSGVKTYHQSNLDWLPAQYQIVDNLIIPKG